VAFDKAVVAATNTNTVSHAEFFNTLAYNNIPYGRPFILYHIVKTDNLSLVKIVISDKDSDGDAVKFATSKNESDGNAGVGDTKASDNASHITDDNVNDKNIESAANNASVYTAKNASDDNNTPNESSTDNASDEALFNFLNILGYNTTPDCILCKSYPPNKSFDEKYENLTTLTNKYSLANDVIMVRLLHT